jgi:hypothetical protein
MVSIVILFAGTEFAAEIECDLRAICEKYLVSGRPDPCRLETAPVLERKGLRAFLIAAVSIRKYEECRPHRSVSLTATRRRRCREKRLLRMEAQRRVVKAVAIVPRAASKQPIAVLSALRRISIYSNV